MLAHPSARSPLRRASVAFGRLLFLLLRGLWTVVLAAVARGAALTGAVSKPPAAVAAPPPGTSAPRAGTCAAQLAAAAARPATQQQPPVPAAAPGAAGTPVAGLAALSLHSPDGREGAAGGGGAPATGQAAPPTLPSLGAGGGGAAASPASEPRELVDDDGVALSAEATASPFSPPATARHAAFLKLVDHAVEAGLQCRHMRDADFCALAAVAGVPLFGDESIIVAYLRATEARELANQAGAEAKRGLAGLADAELPYRRSWVVLLAQALPVIRSRMDKGLLLPGKLRKVEEAYYVNLLQMNYRVKEQPVPSAASLTTGVATFGYVTAAHAAGTALDLLPLPWWRADQRERARNFVVAVLRLIPQTAIVTHGMDAEDKLVDCIERHMTPARHGADFCASVLAAWRSRRVLSVLRSRGALQDGVGAVVASNAEFAARQQADLARKGLRRCGLPSCGKQETTVLQFRVCGHCQTTRYCCPEHAKQHWRVHKREYEEWEEKEGEASGGGGTAA